MRNRGHVLDVRDAKATVRNRPQRGLTARSGALDVNTNALHALIHGLLTGILCDELSCKGSALARTLEAKHTGGGPGNRVAVGIGDGHDGVVERGLNVGTPTGTFFLTFFLT